jgi:pyrroloquinoline quinone (PQQ) biosynthesis protein C
MDSQYLVDIFELEGKLLDATLRHHPMLRPLFSRNFGGVDAAELRHTYLQLLKLKADYVQYTVPALRAAGEALRGGDDDDRRWSERLLAYAAGETDGPQDRGHHVWARDDMRALGAPPELVDAPPHPSAVLYRRYFVDEAVRHPYAILGAKGVLEHFSIRVSDDVVRGIVESGIPRAEDAVSFFSHHGTLDIDHVRTGNRNVVQLVHPQRQFQVLEGAYFTSGAYRALVHHLLPA